MSFDGQIMSHQIWYLFLRSVMSFDGKAICHQIWYLCLIFMTSYLYLVSMTSPPKYSSRHRWCHGWTHPVAGSGPASGPQKPLMWHVIRWPSNQVQMDGSTGWRGPGGWIQCWRDPVGPEWTRTRQGAGQSQAGPGWTHPGRAHYLGTWTCNIFES